MRAWPFFVLLVAACLIHGHQLLGRRLYVRDIHRMYVPAKFFLAETIRRGELPQWWPYDGNGTPFLAQANFSVFHPSTLVYLVLPFWKAMAFQDFIGTLLALTGAYVLARVLKGTRSAAFIAAFVFGANGYFTSVLEFPFTHLAIAGMPWYVAALLVAARKGGWWRIAPSLAMAMVLFAGDPQVAILTALAGLVLILAVEGVRRQTLMLAIGSPVGGASLAAIQLLPSMLLVSETNRALDMAEANQWPLQLKQIAGFVMRTKFGPSEFAPSTFFGPAALVLVLASVIAIKERRVAATWGLLVTGLWLSLGDSFGLNALARLMVPLWGSLRYPIKSMALVTLAAAVLAPLGFDVLCRELRKPRQVMAALMILTAAVFLVAWMILPPASEERVHAGVLLGSSLLTLLACRRPGVRFTVAIFVAAPLVANSVWVQKTVDASYYAEPPMVQVLKSAGVGSEGYSFSSYGITARTQLESNEGYVASVGGWGGGLGSLYHLPSLLYYTPGASLRLIGMFGLHPRSPDEFAWLSGVFGVGALVVRPEEARWPVIGREPRFGYLAVQNPGALPRAYAVHRARTVQGFDEAEAQLKPGLFERGREVLLETDPNPSWSERPLVPGVPLKVERPANNRVVLEGTLPWSGFAVLNETASSGWSVKVGGQLTEWIVANGMVRAVEVPAGSQRIEWFYETPGLQAGASVSGVALLVLLAIGLRRRRDIAPVGVG